MAKGIKIAPAKGKLGILTPGMGAVATTFMAGVFAINKKLADPVGSLTQMGTIRLGKRTDNRNPDIKKFVPLTPMKKIVFGGWDIFKDNAYEAAVNANVLDHRLLEKVKKEMSAIKPMRAVFDRKYVKKLDGPHVKKGKTKMDLAKAVMRDIKKFKKTTIANVWLWYGVDRRRFTLSQGKCMRLWLHWRRA